MLAYYHPNRLAEFSKNYLAEFMESEAVRLRKQHSAFGNAQQLLRCISYFGNWLKKKKIHLKNVNEAVGVRFLKQFRPTKICTSKPISYLKARVICVAVHKVVRYAKELYPDVIPKGSIQHEILDYYEYLTNTCNISVNTCVRYRGFIDAFLHELFSGKKIALHRLSPKMIRDYIAKVPSTLDERKRKDTCSALRHYFRFSRIRGKKMGDLEIGLPSFQSKHQAHLTEMLMPKDLERLLASIDRFTLQGKKVYATILCQTDLCMRLGDVARITLNDIDWRDGKIQINNHKGGVPYWLPLPHRVGFAIADYLKNARPESKSRILFLSPRWWRNKPISAYHIAREIKNQWIIAGLSHQYSGTRLLRHYGATQMKQKECSIKVISDILGHTTFQTTAIYAKVDIPALRQVAQEWPGKVVSHEN